MVHLWMDFIRHGTSAFQEISTSLVRYASANSKSSILTNHFDLLLLRISESRQCESPSECLFSQFQCYSVRSRQSKIFGARKVFFILHEGLEKDVPLVQNSFSPFFLLLFSSFSSSSSSIKLMNIGLDVIYRSSDFEA